MPLYEICVATGLPVLFHSGPGFHPLLYGKSAHPLEFDQVAADFPNLDMILGHAGGDWWQDCVTVAKSHPNIYPEISEWQAKFKADEEGTVRAIDQMIRSLGGGAGDVGERLSGDQERDVFEEIRGGMPGFAVDGEEIRV